MTEPQSTSPTGGGDMAAALRRLEEVLPSRAPRLWASLRPPANAADLAALRAEVRPHQIPREVLALLRWADGQRHDGEWWPAMRCGSLRSAAHAAEHYRFLLGLAADDAASLWNPLWLPVAHDGWSQAVIEMRSGVVIDASFPDPMVTVIGSSLAAVMLASADLVEAGLDAEPDAADGQAYADWKRGSDTIIEACNDQHGWRYWPYDRVIPLRTEAWPAHWRLAVGLPPESDLLRRPPRPLSAVLAEAKERRVEATIEGHVLERVLVDVQASGIQVITFEDATASVRVLVQPETPGHSEASWIGWRLQIDLVGGPEAQREAKRVLEAEPGRRARAPEGDYLLPVAIRLVQQGAWMAPRGGTAAIP